MTTPVPVGALLFGDEFDGVAGTHPDPKKWTGKLHGLASGIHLDGWTNIALDGNGCVVITARKAADGWHSGFLSGFNTATQTGGYSGKRYIEARVRVGKGQGVWNGAVWEWAAIYGAGGIEVDVCEQLGREPQTYHSTLHNWGGSGQQSPHATIPAGKVLGDDFHVYGAAVYPDHIDWYLDGVHMKYQNGSPATVKASEVGLTDLTKFKVVPNISLNMGGWGGSIKIPGPVSLTIDYFHAYTLT
jgi:beta-glucanase (GH16 family)